MIQLAEGIAPPQAALDALKRYQQEVTDAGKYSEQVVKAKERFSAYNKKGNLAFDAVKVTLTAMCSGARRCCYCEDAPADEVEHIWPKDLYPERAFRWENYLYACGPCNGPKNNGFAIFQGDAVRSVARKPMAPVVPPPTGDTVLIDPRYEDPLEFLILDLKTWRFQASAPEGTRDERRATYTLTLLHLNDREYLRQAREEAFEGYVALLEKYITRRDAGKDTQPTRGALRRRGHPTVWREMQRQWDKYDELRSLFGQAPEAQSKDFLEA
ncbi:hypothetical protein [Armatimonas sp.]|uniref:hypothetical protein n=1 Tax=Armatimonas sp. TaxID=1872638 RepID=UPI00286D4EED|nr:hypothetical protein [Armatimonas sp.]